MEYTDIINQPMKKENSFLNKLEYVMIFSLIYISSSFYIGTISGTITLILHFACVFILFILTMLGGKKIEINSNMATKTLTLLAIIGLGAMSSRGDEVKQTIINIAQVLLAYLYSLNFNIDNYLKKFSDIMYFLCYYSIVIYFLYLLVPELIELFPDITNVTGIKAENAFFSTIWGGVGARNESIFWEPGCFQTYINLALIFELFYNKTVTKKRLIVYAIAMLTTYSTTGYITALFIVYTYVTQLLFLPKDMKKTSTDNLFFILTLVLIVAFVFVSIDSNIAEHVFGKLSDYRDSGYATSSKHMTSASVRFDAFIKPFKIFWEYPMFGAGTRGMTNFAYIQRYAMNTCTFINWFAYFGLLFGSLIMKMYYDFCKCFSKNKLIVFMIFFALFLATATENFYRNPSILIFIFFVFPKESEDKKDENITEYQQL